MLELELARYLLCRLSGRLATARLDGDFGHRGGRGDRGDVAEKIVIVGIFVVLAIAAGAIIAKAVTTDANHISNSIIGAKH